MFKRVTHNGFYLGQKVIFKEEERVVIAFNENDTKYVMLKGKVMNTYPVKDSVLVTHISMEHENEYCWEWVRIDSITPLDCENMNKVLDIKITKINEEYSSIEVTHQDTNVIERGLFRDDNINVYSCIEPWYNQEFDRLYLRGEKEQSDKRPFTVFNKHIKSIEEKVKYINEKYTTYTRWRAEKDGTYYFMNTFGDVECSTELNDYMDDKRHMFGNYFKTEEECLEVTKKVKEVLLEVNNEMVR